jgi:hypothetical protein
MEVVRNDKELKKLTKLARKKYEERKTISKVRYEGERGTFEMIFNGEKFVPEYQVRALTGMESIDWEEIHKTILCEW